MSKNRFHYSLEALLRKRRSDWKTVKVEETTAGEVVDRKTAEVTNTKDVVEGAEQLLRDACRDGMQIDPHRHHLLTNYLVQQRTVLKQKQQALVKAREVHDQVTENLVGIGRGIKSLEKHRTGKEEQHKFELNLQEQKVTDELWLLRQGPHKGRG